MRQTFRNFSKIPWEKPEKYLHLSFTIVFGILSYIITEIVQDNRQILF